MGRELDDIPVLARSEMLAALNHQDLGELLPHLEVVEARAGSTLPAPTTGTAGASIVLRGWVRVAGGVRAGALVGAGGTFGEAQLADSRCDQDAAVVTGDARVAYLTRERYRRLQDTHPHLALGLANGVMRRLAQREVEAARRSGLLGVRDTRRVAGMLAARSGGHLTVAARVDERLVSLDEMVGPEQHAEAVTTDTPSGRSVFRRSAGLVLLEAARRAGYPSLRLGPSIRSGRIVPLHGGEVDISAITGTLTDLVQAGVPLWTETWRIARAIAHFEAQGWSGAAALLNLSADTSVELLCCGELRALGPGPLVPTSTMLEGVALLPHPDGLLLDYGPSIRRALATRPQSTLLLERRAPRYGAPMTRRQHQWLDTLGVSTAGHFNERCVQRGVDDIIFISEGFHERHIANIADAVAGREGARVVLVAGPSASGKTTFIQRLKVQIEVNGLHPVMLSLDNYYRERQDVPTDAAGKPNYDVLESLHLALFNEHVRRLLNGERVRTARYDFRASKLSPAGGPELQLLDKHVLLVEGIFGLNPALLPEVDSELLFRIFIQPALSLPFDRLTHLDPTDVRLARRIVRDRHRRGFSADDNLERWATVIAGERLSIFPFQQHADVVFDRSLIYEPSIMRIYADRYLLEVPRDHPQHDAAQRLRRILQRFVPIHPNLVPPTSILREFIGGSGFSYH